MSLNTALNHQDKIKSKFQRIRNLHSEDQLMLDCLYMMLQRVENMKRQTLSPADFSVWNQHQQVIKRAIKNQLSIKKLPAQ